MQFKNGGLCAAIIACAAMLGCDRVERNAESRVEGEVEDLQQARGQSAAEVRRLEDELAQAKGRVVELEKKLALARQGITDDVIEERRQLGEVLEEERQDVRGEIQEAKESAERHNRATDRAEGVLEQTTPPDVEAEVRSGSRVTPEQEQLERTQQREDIVVEDVRGVETEREGEHRNTQEGESPAQPLPVQPQPAQPQPAQPQPVVP